MPLTILEIAKAEGVMPDERGCYYAGALDDVGLPFFGGCQHCGASLAAGNMYPSRNGWVACRECVEDDGYETHAEFLRDNPRQAED